VIPELKSSYRGIIRGTTTFGSIQLFQIITGIIKSKLIAILLGPTGFGIMSLLQSTLSLLSGIINFGVSTSGVQSLAGIDPKDEKNHFYRTTRILNFLMISTGIVGVTITILAAERLSLMTFGNSRYKISFIILSVTMLLGQVYSGHIVVAQSIRKQIVLAKILIYSNALSLLSIVPVFYFSSSQSIVLLILLPSFGNFLVSFYFVNKLKIPAVNFSFREFKFQSLKLLQMGFFVSLSGIVSVFFSYILRLGINRYGSTDDVGLFNACFTIVNSYIGIVFSSMTLDYFPRLSALSKNSNDINSTINQQIEITLIIISILISAFSFFSELIIQLLYSSEFLAMHIFLICSLFSVLFKAISWPIAYLFLVQEKKRVYFLNEVVASVMLFILNIIGYKYGGLTGIGISYILGYLLYLIQVYFISKKLYSFAFNAQALKIIFINIGLVSVLMILLIVLFNEVYFIIKLLLFLVIILLNIYALNKRIDLISFCDRYFKKRN
jgi:O-antigen/teichoic acid export membrane protein